MPIVLENFVGSIPRVNPRLLAPNVAADATDVRIESGDLAPMRGNIEIHDFGAVNAQSFYRIGNEFLVFANRFTKAALVPTLDDRVIYTNTTTTPRLWTPALGTVGLKLGPPPAPSGLTPIVGPNPRTQEERVFYAQTWVTSLGEETRPSPLSPMVTGGYGVGWGIAMTLPGVASGRITKRRIYRSKTTASGVTELFFRAELPAAATTYNDMWSQNDLQEPCPSMDWNEPPDFMVGITSMPNGMMAAHSRHEVFFCEPYVPHAWPVKYRLTIPENIQALVSFGSSLAVLTDGTPYILQGLHPEAMAMEKMEQPYPCVSARGAVDMGYSAIYPSYDGLVEITPTGARLISQSIWTREQWNALDPATMIASHYNGRYVLRVGGEGGRLLLIDTAREAPFVIDTTTNGVKDLQNHQASGRLMVLQDTKVSFFDAAGAALLSSATWRSKPFEHSPPESYGAVMVRATDIRPGSTVTIRVEGKLLATIPGTAFNQPVRLPPGTYSVWEVAAFGGSTITRIVVAKTMHEARAL